MSNALRGGKGRFILKSSITGSSLVETRTTKLPRPGFSLLISTTALSPTALAILLARVLNAPHCLQASMITLRAVASLEAAAFLAAGVGPFAAAFFGGPFLTGFFAVTGTFFFFSPDAARAELRLLRPMTRSFAFSLKQVESNNKGDYLEDCDFIVSLSRPFVSFCSFSSISDQIFWRETLVSLENQNGSTSSTDRMMD